MSDKHIEIADIMRRIDARELVVPAFQRGYVWDRDCVKGFVHSLLHRFPIGSLIVWRTSEPPELKGCHGPAQGEVTLLLDGLQRVSTLYMLLTGKIPPYYTAKDVCTDTRNLLVNVCTLEVDHYRATAMAGDPAWVDFTDIIAQKISVADLKSRLINNYGDRGLPAELGAGLDRNLATILAIRDIEFQQQPVPQNADISQAIKVFHIANSSGVRLSDVELALAQICGYWPQARGLFKDRCERFASMGWSVSTDFIVCALQAVLFLQASRLEKLHSAANKERLQEAWDALSENVLEDVFAMLKEHAYVDHSDEISTEHVLIPIVVYFYLNQGKEIPDKQVRKMVKWFYCAQMRFYYFSLPLSKLDKDLKTIEDNDGAFDILLRNVRDDRGLKILPEEFKGQGVRHPLFSLMCWCFKSRGATCPRTGELLRRDMNQEYALYREPIFPHDSLREAGDLDLTRKRDRSLSLEITNQVFIAKEATRSRAVPDAWAYLLEVARNNPAALESQCIPSDINIWWTDRYRQFLDVRREMLADMLNDFLDGLADDGLQEAPEVDYEELARHGENDTLELKPTLSYDRDTGKRSKDKEFLIIKSLAAFGNNQGGTLIIGMEDDGEVCGLGDDYDTLAKGNKDGFELHLHDLICTRIGTSFDASCISVSFPAVGGAEICVIEVSPSADPLYIAPRDGDIDNRRFFVRIGNSSRAFSTEDALKYISSHFKMS